MWSLMSLFIYSSSAPCTHSLPFSMLSSLLGNLQNILKQEQQAADGGENAVTLEDFDLLAVLG